MTEEHRRSAPQAHVMIYDPARSPEGLTDYDIYVREVLGIEEWPTDQEHFLAKHLPPDADPERDTVLLLPDNGRGPQRSLPHVFTTTKEGHMASHEEQSPSNLVPRNPKNGPIGARNDVDAYRAKEKARREASLREMRKDGGK